MAGVLFSRLRWARMISDVPLCARTAAKALGFTLEELPEWQCCGAVYPMARDEIATRLSSVRALVAAREAGEPLVTLCSACHHVIKRVNGDMQHNDEIRTKVNNYLKPETPYAGETKVLHYLEVLRDEIGFLDIGRLVEGIVDSDSFGGDYTLADVHECDRMARAYVEAHI